MNQTIDDLRGCCTGCGACYSTCENNAITYSMNEFGFFEAKINNDCCSKCGICAKVCIKNPKNSAEHCISKINSVYAAQSKNKNILYNSTSGGIAYELAKYMLTQGVNVVGTFYNLENRRAETIVVDDLCKLKLIQGSKYLQSNCAETFRKIITETKNDHSKKYIVFGTPCQIFGLSKVAQINHVREQMIFVELFCHGVPSYLLWERYLFDLEKKKKIKGNINDISFRDKKYGWNIYTMKIKNQAKDFYVTSESSSFYKAYFDEIALNNACFKCKLRGDKSEADIRLGDFWGTKYASRNDGISAVILLTEQGKDLWDYILEDILILGKHDITECTNYQSTEEYEINDKQRALFYYLLKKDYAMNKVIKEYRKQFVLKKRIKLLIKDSVSILPMDLKLLIKRKYNKYKYKGKI